MKRLILAVLFLSGCSYSPQYHIVRDAFNSQTYAPTSTYAPTTTTTTTRMTSIPDCEGCTAAESLEYWRKIEQYYRQKMQEDERVDRERGKAKANHVIRRTIKIIPNGR
jgi:hypothetical protein